MTYSQRSQRELAEGRSVPDHQHRANAPERAAAASAANDDCRNDNQTEITDPGGLVRRRVENRDLLDSGPEVQRGNLSSQLDSQNFERNRIPLGYGWIVNGQQNVCALAHATDQRNLVGMGSLIAVVVVMSQFMVIASTNGITILFRLVTVATRAEIGATVNAANFALVADAQIQRPAHSCEELRRRQHQDQQRFGHERSDWANTSDIVILSALSGEIHDGNPEIVLSVTVVMDAAKTRDGNLVNGSMSRNDAETCCGTEVFMVCNSRTLYSGRHPILIGEGEVRRGSMQSDQPEVTCTHCGSREISQGMKLRLGNPLTELGLIYDKGVLFSAVEPLLMNVCRDCGTVVRIYVENPKREWD